METRPTASLWAQTIGYLCLIIGVGCWLLLIASIFFALMHPRSDRSSLPLIAAALAALGTIGWTSGTRLTQGLPVAVPLLRRLGGVVLLIAATIVWIAGLSDSDVPLWPAIVLAIGGLGLFLTWRMPRMRDGRLHD